jgi:hypothetical protein
VLKDHSDSSLKESEKLLSETLKLKDLGSLKKSRGKLLRYKARIFMQNPMYELGVLTVVCLNLPLLTYSQYMNLGLVREWEFTIYFVAQTIINFLFFLELMAFFYLFKPRESFRLNRGLFFEFLC